MPHKANFLFLSIIFLLSCSPNKAKEKVNSSTQVTNELRIISRSPSTTTMLLTLGKSKLLVGKTPWCNGPESLEKISNTGGLINPDIEKIISLKPDYVLYSDGETSRKEAEKLQKLNIKTAFFKNLTLSDIDQSILEMGQLLNAQTKANEWTNQKDEIVKKVQSLSFPNNVKVLVATGRNKEGSLSQVYVAAPDSFHGELLKLMGVVNAVTKTYKQYPIWNQENMIQAKPDIIIELSPENKAPELLIENWNKLKTPAAQNKQIYILNASYVLQPSPDYPKLLEDLSEKIIESK